MYIHLFVVTKIYLGYFQYTFSFSAIIFRIKHTCTHTDEIRNVEQALDSVTPFVTKPLLRSRNMR